MSDTPLDPRFEKLVAMLYGELSPADEKALRLEMESDASLRREWEELSEGHVYMEALEEPAAPSFVFLHEAESVPVRQIVPEAKAPWWKSLGNWGAGPVWAATAAVLLLAFVITTDFRVYGVDGGLAMRFGEPASRNFTLPAGSNQLTPQLQAGGQNPATMQQAAYLTPQDMETYEARMVRLFGAMLQDYGRYKDREISGMVTAAVNELAFRQDLATKGLRDRIDAMGVGVTQTQGDLEMRFQNLERANENSLEPVPASEKEN